MIVPVDEYVCRNFFCFYNHHKPMPRASQLFDFIVKAAEWEFANDYLAANERGTESDTGLSKIGPGHWNSLEYTDPVAEGSSEEEGGGGGTWEVPTGDIDGENDTFTCTGPPVAFFKNGIEQHEFGSVVGSTFVYSDAEQIPDDGDYLGAIV